MVKNTRHSEETKKKIALKLRGNKHRLGLVSPFKNQHHSLEARQKIRLAHFGKKHSIETREKMGSAHKGEKAYNWKGGLRGENYAGRREFQHTIQKLVFERDNYTCQICFIRGGDLQVDHIQSWAEYVELRFSMDNCRTLCARCHYKITFGKPMPENIKGWGHNFLLKGKGYQNSRY